MAEFAHMVSALVSMATVYAPKVAAIFGSSVAVCEFIIRDKEQDHLRDFFTSIWYKIDNASKLLTRITIKNRFAILTLAVIGIFTSFVQYGAMMYYHSCEQDTGLPYFKIVDTGCQEFRKSFTNPNIFMSAILISVVLFLLFVSIPGSYILKNYTKDYVNNSISEKTFSGLYFRFSRVPVILFLFNTILIANIANTNSSFLPISKYAKELKLGSLFTSSLYLIPLSYIQGAFIPMTMMMIIYLPIMALIITLNRLALRVAESKRGPVLAVSSAIAISGVLVEFLLTLQKT